ncbi:hypothetical protein H0H92_006366, partial [Tricholoma furcatifolium]
MECKTAKCKKISLRQSSKYRDIPPVTLLQDGKIIENALVLSGKCKLCGTIYYADHESYMESNTDTTDDNSKNAIKVYLNTAKYLQLGRNIWADRAFTNAVVNGIYHFHASTSAFSAFWNDVFFVHIEKSISRRQVWTAFVQETIRQVAAESDILLELSDKLSQKEVTKQAFELLGENGIIRSAENHSCPECTQPYKSRADRITGDDPAAVLGVDENRTVPALEGEDAALAVQDAAYARRIAEDAMNIDENENNDNIDINAAP